MLAANFGSTEGLFVFLQGQSKSALLSALGAPLKKRWLQSVQVPPGLDIAGNFTVVIDTYGASFIEFEPSVSVAGESLSGKFLLHADASVDSGTLTCSPGKTFTINGLNVEGTVSVSISKTGPSISFADFRLDLGGSNMNVDSGSSFSLSTSGDIFGGSFPSNGDIVSGELTASVGKTVTIDGLPIGGTASVSIDGELRTSISFTPGPFNLGGANVQLDGSFTLSSSGGIESGELSADVTSMSLCPGCPQISGRAWVTVTEDVPAGDKFWVDGSATAFGLSITGRLEMAGTTLESMSLAASPHSLGSLGSTVRSGIKDAVYSGDYRNWLAKGL